MGLNAAAVDTRIKAAAAITMYDMSRVSANGYFDAEDSAAERHKKRKPSQPYWKKKLYCLGKLYLYLTCDSEILPAMYFKETFVYMQ